ncbi:Imm21 family immunity protein [Streptomyces bottropensis]|uniref:Imm21 family immunity protein n=1 Tax=Streptomyces bottropensis TaxID=42235 RepID=UPI0036B0B4D4
MLTDDLLRGLPGHGQHEYPEDQSHQPFEQGLHVGGGSLIVIPVFELAAWRGCTEARVMAGDATAPDDHDRACAVDDLAGVITVGENGAQARVLADEPATSCYLPEPSAEPSCAGLPPTLRPV